MRERLCGLRVWGCEIIMGLAQEHGKSRDTPIHRRCIHRHLMDRPATTQQEIARGSLARYPPGPFNMSVCFELIYTEIVFYLYASIALDIEAVKKALPDKIGGPPYPNVPDPNTLQAKDSNRSRRTPSANGPSFANRRSVPPRLSRPSFIF